MRAFGPHKPHLYTQALSPRALLLSACVALLTGCGGCDGVDLKYEPVDRNNATATNNATGGQTTTTGGFDGARLSLEPILATSPGQRLNMVTAPSLIDAIGRDAALVLTLCADAACETPTLTRELGSAPMGDLLQERFGPLLDIDGLPAGEHHVMLHARARTGDALGLPADRSPEHLDLMLAGPAPALDAEIPGWPTPQTIPVTLRDGEAVDLGKVWLGALADRRRPNLPALPSTLWVVGSERAYDLASPEGPTLPAADADAPQATWLCAYALPSGDLLALRDDGRLMRAAPGDASPSPLLTIPHEALYQCTIQGDPNAHITRVTLTYSVSGGEGQMRHVLTLPSDGAPMLTAPITTPHRALLLRGDMAVLAISSTPGDAWTDAGGEARTILLTLPVAEDGTLPDEGLETYPWRAIPAHDQCWPELRTVQTQDGRLLLFAGACGVWWADLTEDASATGEQALEALDTTLYGAQFRMRWDADSRTLVAIPSEPSREPLYIGPERERVSWIRRSAMLLRVDDPSGPTPVQPGVALALGDDSTPIVGLDLTYAEEAHTMLGWAVPPLDGLVSSLFLDSPDTKCISYVARARGLWCLTPRQGNLQGWDLSTGAPASPPGHTSLLWANTLFGHRGEDVLAFDNNRFAVGLFAP